MTAKMSSDAITTSKKGDEVEPMEDVQKDVVPHELPLPEELADMSTEQVAELERGLVKRLDCTLMPVCVLLFLLNIL